MSLPNEFTGTSSVRAAPLKVLWVLPYYEAAIVYGGPARALPLLCQALVSQGVEVSVLTTDANGRDGLDVPLRRPLLSGGVEVSYYPRLAAGRFALSPELALACGRRCAGFDLVHTAGLFTFPSLVALRLAAARGVPAVLSPTGELMPWALGHKATKKRAFMRFVGAGQLRRAAALHCTDDLERQAAAALGLQKPIYLVPNALDTARFRDLPPRGALRHAMGIPAGGPLILCLGRLHPVKRPDLALEAFVLVAGRFPTAHLLFAGPDEAGQEPYLRAVAAEAGCAGRVHFAGLLDRAGVLQALSDADLVLVASESESFGMAAAEAMAAGLPLVISERVGLARYVARSGAGCVTPLDAGAIAGHVADLLADPASLPAIGRQGQNLAVELFGLEPVGRQLVAAYRQVLAAQPR
jgi:glycosyltransferase involved in cell wall biosynthesis